MTTHNIGRRNFLKTTTVAGAGLGAALGAPAVLAQRRIGEKIGVAVIGVGTRGFYLMQQFQNIEDVEIRSICDLYDGNLKRARQNVRNDRVRTTKEWEKVMADPDIDAVVIATPDFWHAPMTIAAAEAKKDVYVEKGWCVTLDQAKAMRKAILANSIVMQLGHNYNSDPFFHKAREIYQSGQLGKVTSIRLFIDRTRQWPEWQFFQDYNIYEMPKDANAGTIDWNRFIAGAAEKRSFDPERFFLWRKWWDYGTGIAGDLMSHLWDSANMVAGMGAPKTAVTQGGVYFWKDGRNVPDNWNVLFDYPERELIVSFQCTFSNRHYGEVEQFLGREMTLEVAPGVCRTFAAEWKPDFAARQKQAAEMAVRAGIDPRDFPVPPDYSMKKGELEVTSHWQNFIDCVRSRAMPRCGVDRAFEEAVAVFMSVEAFKRETKVKWDAEKEEIV
ncbi:MAG: Gfo/Idh/MocA family oxidoreductase [Bryobacteraceae bacterium]|nr:Gfo/Idh/MocA family oxidoreductase [Bryobacteraceae bacterium]